jgi:hypothetical protein
MLVALSFLVVLSLYCIKGVAFGDDTDSTGGGTSNTPYASVINLDKDGNFLGGTDNDHFYSNLRDKQQDYIYYGNNLSTQIEESQNDQTQTDQVSHEGAILWRVLTKNDKKYATKEGSLLLWSDYMLGTSTYNGLSYLNSSDGNNNNNNPNYAFWGTSYMHALLNGGTYLGQQSDSSDEFADNWSSVESEDSYYGLLFSDNERASIVNSSYYTTDYRDTWYTNGVDNHYLRQIVTSGVTTSSDSGNYGYYRENTLTNKSATQSNVDYSSGKVIEYVTGNNEKMFLLDYYDINNTAYGFGDDGVVYADKVINNYNTTDTSSYKSYKSVTVSSSSPYYTSSDAYAQEVLAMYNAEQTLSTYSSTNITGYPWYYYSTSDTDVNASNEITSSYLAVSNDLAVRYWLRPAGRIGAYESRGLTAGAVGNIFNSRISLAYGVRPAFNFDPDSIIYATSASTANLGSTLQSVITPATSGTYAYKVYQKTSNYVNYNSSEQSENKPELTISGSNLVINIPNGADATTVLLSDGESGSVAYMAQVDSIEGESSTAIIDLNGIDISGYTVSVLLSDNLNGDNYSESITGSYVVDGADIATVVVEQPYVPDAMATPTMSVGAGRYIRGINGSQGVYYSSMAASATNISSSYTANTITIKKNSSDTTGVAGYVPFTLSVSVPARSCYTVPVTFSFRMIKYGNTITWIFYEFYSFGMKNTIQSDAFFKFSSSSSNTGLVQRNNIGAGQYDLTFSYPMSLTFSNTSDEAVLMQYNFGFLHMGYAPDSVACSGYCTLTYTSSASTLTHIWDDEYSVDETYHWKKCIMESSEGEDCTTVADKAEHSYSDWVVDEPATYVGDGLRHKTCSVCGYQYDEVIEKLKLSRNYTYVNGLPVLDEGSEYVEYVYIDSDGNEVSEDELEIGKVYTVEIRIKKEYEGIVEFEEISGGDGGTDPGGSESGGSESGGSESGGSESGGSGSDGSNTGTGTDTEIGSGTNGEKGTYPADGTITFVKGLKQPDFVSPQWTYTYNGKTTAVADGTETSESLPYTLPYNGYDYVIDIDSSTFEANGLTYTIDGDTTEKTINTDSTVYAVTVTVSTTDSNVWDYDSTTFYFYWTIEKAKIKKVYDTESGLPAIEDAPTTPDGDPILEYVYYDVNTGEVVSEEDLEIGGEYEVVVKIKDEYKDLYEFDLTTSDEGTDGEYTEGEVGADTDAKTTTGAIKFTRGLKTPTLNKIQWQYTNNGQTVVIDAGTTGTYEVTYNGYEFVFSLNDDNESLKANGVKISSEYGGTYASATVNKDGDYEATVYVVVYDPEEWAFENNETEVKLTFVWKINKIKLSLSYTYEGGLPILDEGSEYVEYVYIDPDTGEEVAEDELVIGKDYEVQIRIKDEFKDIVAFDESTAGSGDSSSSGSDVGTEVGSEVGSGENGGTGAYPATGTITFKKGLKQPDFVSPQWTYTYNGKTTAVADGTETSESSPYTLPYNGYDYVIDIDSSTFEANGLTYTIIGDTTEKTINAENTVYTVTVTVSTTDPNTWEYTTSTFTFVWKIEKAKIKKVYDRESGLPTIEDAPTTPDGDPILEYVYYDAKTGEIVSEEDLEIGGEYEVVIRIKDEYKDLYEFDLTTSDEGTDGEYTEGEVGADTDAKTTTGAIKFVRGLKTPDLNKIQWQYTNNGQTVVIDAGTTGTYEVTYNGYEFVFSLHNDSESLRANGVEISSEYGGTYASATVNKDGDYEATIYIRVIDTAEWEFENGDTEIKLTLVWKINKIKLSAELNGGNGYPTLADGSSVVENVYYDENGNEVKEEDLVTGESYTVKVVIKDEYRDTYEFDTDSAETESGSGTKDTTESKPISFTMGKRIPTLTDVQWQYTNNGTTTLVGDNGETYVVTYNNNEYVFSIVTDDLAKQGVKIKGEYGGTASAKLVTDGDDLIVTITLVALDDALWDYPETTFTLNWRIDKIKVSQNFVEGQRLPVLEDGESIENGESIVEYIYIDPETGEEISEDQLETGKDYIVKIKIKDEYADRYEFDEAVSGGNGSGSQNGTNSNDGIATANETGNIPFHIDYPTALQLPTFENATLVYNGNAQTFVLQGIQSIYEEYDVTSLVRTDAGKYTLTVSIKRGANAEWADGNGGSDREISFEIEKYTITVDWDMTGTVPVLKLPDNVPESEVTYKYFDSKGNEIQASEVNGDKSYTVSAILSDSYAKNYMFSDSREGTTELKIGGESTPVWQITLIVLCGVLGVAFCIVAFVNMCVINTLKGIKKTKTNSVAGLGMMTALLASVNTALTVVAIVVIVLSVLAFIVMLYTWIKRYELEKHNKK